MSARGFTLLEVVVALAVLALTLAALVRATTLETRAQAHADAQEAALGVARRLLVGLRLERDPVLPGRREGVAEEGLRYRLTIGETPERALLRVEVQIFRPDPSGGEVEPLASLTGFVGR